MLKLIRKGITLDQARHAVKCCRDADIMPHASFMVGLPGESKETLEETARFANDLNIAYGYHFFAPFPGTTVREELEDYDIEILTDDWSRYDANSPIVKTSKLNPEEMKAFVDEYDRNNEDLWKQTLDRHRQGTCSDREYLLVEGYRKMNLVYKVLSEDIIEEISCKIDNGADPVMLLSTAVANRTGTDESFTYNIIKGFFDAGYVRHERSDGTLRYYWTHNKDVDTLPIAF